mgnify:CR=1 FL=1
MLQDNIILVMCLYSVKYFLNSASDVLKDMEQLDLQPLQHIRNREFSNTLRDSKSVRASGNELF